MSIKQEEEKSKIIKDGEFQLKNAIDEFINKKYDESLNIFRKIQEDFKKEQSSSHISICLSFIGLIEYLKDKTKYLKALTQINDATYLANFSNDTNAKIINEFVLGEIDYSETNLETAILHYKNALRQTTNEDGYNLEKLIKERMHQAKESSISVKKDPLVALLKIGQAVSAETDIDILLKVIAEETKSAIQADRCSVFLYDKKNDEIWSKVALGLGSQEIRFKAGKGLAGHVIKTGETINIKEAYIDSRFNKEIDLQTGYKTKSILCMPIKNLKQEIIGAFQVLNKLDGSFTEEDEDLLVAIGSSVGVALENAQLFKKQQEMFIEQKQIFDSFIDTLATSIDARDKITSGHSSRVRMYAKLIAEQLHLDERMTEIIEKAATLHDIGKIGIRDSVLQKEGKLTDEEYKHIQEHVEITHHILEKIHMSDDFKLVTEIACSHHEKYDGTGYYRKLKGEDITFGGRILAVSDVFDAITSKRHYRDKMPIGNVLNILIKDSGTHFDKSIVDVFLTIPTDKMVMVFLTESNLNLDESHKEILSKHTMGDVYKLLVEKQPEDLADEEKEFISLFQMYYIAKSSKDNQD